MSGVVLIVSIPDICLLPHFLYSHEYRLTRNIVYCAILSDHMVGCPLGVPISYAQSAIHWRTTYQIKCKLCGGANINEIQGCPPVAFSQNFANRFLNNAIDFRLVYVRYTCFIWKYKCLILMSYMAA